MSQSTNAKSKPTEGLYTDTDPDNRSEIITDVTIRMPGKAGTMMMEVKVDPGAQPSCIPLHKFKTSNTCQKEGTNRVKGGNRQGAGLSDRRGNHHGAS